MKFSKPFPNGIKYDSFYCWLILLIVLLTLSYRIILSTKKIIPLFLVFHLIFGFVLILVQKSCIISDNFAVSVTVILNNLLTIRCSRKNRKTIQRFSTFKNVFYSIHFLIIELWFLCNLYLAKTLGRHLDQPRWPFTVTL